MEILSAENVSFTYPGYSAKALDNVSFTIHKGDFTLLCGPSGSGKSTLLKLIKPGIAPHGKQMGEITYKQTEIKAYDSIQLTKEIGMVFQDPENQIVMDHVLDELLFGMENLGFPTVEMRKKVAEIVHFFGLTELMHKKTIDLSGGEKQLLNLASVLLLEPEVLLLDEPTAQLDPIAAKEFIQMLKRLNDEFGITIVVVEHRLDELFSMSNRVILLENGKVVIDSTPKNVIKCMYSNMRRFLPAQALLYLDFEADATVETIPLTVREARQWLSKRKISVHPSSRLNVNPHEPYVELKQIDFQYTKNGRPILDNASISVMKGEWLAIVGANGTGKTTLLKIIGGLLKPQHGRIRFNGKHVKKLERKQIGYLPQNPRLFFLEDSLIREYERIAENHHKTRGDIDRLLEAFQMKHLLDRHPYDLSGGELQKAALIGILLGSPTILLMDEPTKGMDPEFKHTFGTLIRRIQNKGITVIMVTHDVEFAANYATRCSMLFQGEITVIENTWNFFQGNRYYTTIVNRICRNSHVPPTVTLEEARYLWKIESGS